MINVLKDNLIFEKDEVLKNNKLTKIYLSSYYSKLEGN